MRPNFTVTAAVNRRYDQFAPAEIDQLRTALAVFGGEIRDGYPSAELVLRITADNEVHANELARGAIAQILHPGVAEVISSTVEKAAV